MTTEKMTMVKAINSGLRASMEADSKVVVMGEDIGRLGGVFRVTEGLQKDFGDHRVMDTPLAESAIVGTAIGLTFRGFRPVIEIQFDGFVYPAYDQIVSQVARMHFRSSGKVRMPVVIRIPYGGGIGAVEHHSDSPEGQFAMTAGLKVVAPSTPHDAHWMIQQAIASDDPIVFMEPKRRYWESGQVDTGSTDLPLWSSQVVRPGRDATLITYGPMVKTCLASRPGRTTCDDHSGRSVDPVSTWPDSQ
jgi:2-oxoisovalerate dehydrogenase E1 component beta subunit